MITRGIVAVLVGVIGCFACMHNSSTKRRREEEEYNDYVEDLRRGIRHPQVPPKPKAKRYDDFL